MSIPIPIGKRKVCYPVDGRLMLIALYTSLVMLNAGPTEERALPPSPSGWSMTAGIVGVASGVSVLGLAFAAERLKLRGSLGAIPYGISVLSLGAVVPPLVFLSGWGGRKTSGARGAPALRVAGWIMYGGFLTAGAVTAAYGLQRKEPINGMIALMGGFAALSLSLFAADAFVAWHQARVIRHRVSARSVKKSAILPWLAPVYSAELGTGGLVGVTGWF